MEREMLRSSEVRLWSLVEQRTKPGADVEAIDARIWELFGEDWAVVFTDLAGFSRRTEKFGIIHFLQVIHEHHQLLQPIIVDCGGFLVKSEADSYLLLFRTIASALQCCVEMQRACRMLSERRLPEEQVLLCIGVGYGRILRVGEHDVWGVEVNAASKLGEDTAQAHEILLTGSARDAIGEPEGIEFERIEVDVGGSPVNYRTIYSQ